MQKEYIRIKKRDFFRLPASMRPVSDGLMVLSVVNGRETFVRAVIIDEGNAPAGISAGAFLQRICFVSL